MLTFSKQKLLIASLCYIYIPVAIFLFGWTKLYIAIACSAALIFGIVMLYRDYTEKQTDCLFTKKSSFFAVLLFFLFVGYYAGWGRFTEQSSDWWKHNMILADLIDRSWPVYYVNDGEHSMLTYYLGQYMVPALVGKICRSYRIAEIATLVWAEVGLLLVYLNMVRILKIRKWYMQWMTAGLLCFFNGPLILAQKVAVWIYSDLEDMLSNYQWFVWRDDVLLQYSNHFVLLRWVFPQVLVIWICLLFFYEHKDMVQHYIALLMPCVFFGILPFAGMLPIVIGYAALLLFQEKGTRKWIRQVCSLQNCLLFLTFGVVMILYYYGNVLSEKPAVIGFRRVEYGGRGWLYIIFVVFMALLYCGCILKENRRNGIFYMVALSLTIIPIFRMGRFNDWVMRCSIPALFILFILIVKFYNDRLTGKALSGRKSEKRIENFPAVFLTVCVVVGLISPLQELSEIIAEDSLAELGSELTGTMENYANRNSSRLQGQEDLVYNYFSYDVENNFFCRFIARNKWE